jgi:hypothetical protein
MKSNILPIGAVAALAALALAPQASCAANPNFHVFLAFGQSNMEGQAPPESQDYVANSRFKALSSVTCSGQTDGKSVSKTQGQWSSAVAPIVRCDTHLGPLEWFGKTLADSLPATDTIGVVVAAVGGTAIRGFVSSVAASYYASQASWMQTYAGYYGNNPYARLVAEAKVAQQTGVINGILLHQGETDGYQSGWGDTVKTIYNNLLSDLGLNAADVPLLAGEVYNNSGTNAGIDALPGKIPTAHVISSQGLSIGTYSNNQGVHFSAASYRTLGQRYAQQMLKLLKPSSSIRPATDPEASANADYAVYDLEGARVAVFHAQDLSSVDRQWASLRRTLPNGIYWMRNSSTGSSRTVVAGR